MKHFQLPETDFLAEIEKVVRPSAPIDKFELLLGRDEDLTDIRRSLHAAGRHVFIYGDRGVGKTSLALTAAYDYQSSESDPVTVSCGPNETFADLIKSIVRKGPEAVLNPTTKKTSTGIDARVVKGSREVNEVSEAIGSEITIDRAISLVAQAFASAPAHTVVVVDEVDMIKDRRQTSLLASFIKALGDRAVPIKFIFTGVASTLDELLAEHQSAFRQLHPVRLERLMLQYLGDFVVQVFEHFDLEVDDSVKWKIGQVSDGFPAYVHIICRSMLLHIYDNDLQIEEVKESELYSSIDHAIREVADGIKQPYEMATGSKDQVIEHLIWATADSQDLERQLAHVKRSYQSICYALSIEPLQEGMVSAKLNKLKQPSHGQILSAVPPNKKGWYQFTESMVRGYARLKAMQRGIELTYEPDKPDLVSRPQPYTKPRHVYRDPSNYIPNMRGYGSGPRRESNRAPKRKR